MKPIIKTDQRIYGKPTWSNTSTIAQKLWWFNEKVKATSGTEFIVSQTEQRGDELWVRGNDTEWFNTDNLLVEQKPKQEKEQMKPTIEIKAMAKELRDMCIPEIKALANEFRQEMDVDDFNQWLEIFLSQKAYTVWLDSVGAKKIWCIKIVREVTNMGLKEAKDFVELVETCLYNLPQGSEQTYVKGTSQIVKVFTNEIDAWDLRNRFVENGSVARVM